MCLYQTTPCPKAYSQRKKDHGLRAFHKSIIHYYTALTIAKKKKNRTEYETTIISKGLKEVLIKNCTSSTSAMRWDALQEKPFYSYSNFVSGKSLAVAIVLSVGKP